MRDYIDDIGFADDKHEPWKGSSSDLEKLLNKNDEAKAFLRRLAKVCPSPEAYGTS